MSDTRIKRPRLEALASVGLALCGCAAQPGDPAVWPTGYGFGAAGVHYGGGGGIAIFSRIPVIFSYWGLSLSPY